MENKSDTKIAILGDHNKFMFKSIVQRVEEAGYSALPFDFNVDSLDTIDKEITIYVMYLEEESDDQALIFLKDIAIERDILLYLIGNDENIKEVTSVLGEDKITKTFLRPFNAKVLIDELDKAVIKEAKKRENKKILVVDDDGTMLRTLKQWLSVKYNVSIVNSGMNAITFLAGNHVDLILLDYEMPVTSGPQVLEMLRSESGTRDIPVMFLTAKSDRESVMKVVALKPEKYLLKTMSREELIKNIDEFFEKQ